MKGINGRHCLVPCCALSLEAEQVIIGKERNIGDGRCPELGAGRGGGGAAVPAGDPAPLLPQSVIRLDRNRNCPPPPQADGHMWSSPSSGRAGGTPDPCPAPAT